METAVSVLDVAAYILGKFQGMGKPVTAMKLQKLVYYSQAWSLVWDETPLFSERIFAWANGPVVPALYEKHRGEFHLTCISGGNSERLSTNQQDTVDQVLETYGDRTAQWLSDLSHLELPWKQARGNLSDGERGEQEISLASMEEYYAGLMPDDGLDSVATTV
ncbi:MAG: Panacea domain-containing protein [Chlamydiia bacterium]